MSAFEKVRNAKEAIEAAEKQYAEEKKAYDTAIEGAVAAIKAKNTEETRKILDSIGFKPAGEDSFAYERLLSAALHIENHYDVFDSIDTSVWRTVKEYAPVKAGANVRDFFYWALNKGSSEILNDILPFYDKAGENWHYNWNADNLFVGPDNYIGKEDQLLERLKCVDILIEAKCPAARLSPVLSRLAQFGRLSDTLGLSDTTLDVISKTYVAVADKHIAEGHTRFLLPEEYHLVPPENMPAAREFYKKAQVELEGGELEEKRRSKVAP